MFTDNIFIDSSALYSSPSVIKGIARLFDLFGQLDEYNSKPTEEEADGAAIKRDWCIIGLDIAHAIKTYGKTHPTRTPGK